MAAGLEEVAHLALAALTRDPEEAPAAILALRKALGKETADDRCILKALEPVRREALQVAGQVAWYACDTLRLTLEEFREFSRVLEILEGEQQG